MKYFFTLLIFSLFTYTVSWADDVNTDVVFVDADGNVIADGTVLTVTTVEYDELSDEPFLPSGLYVRNDAGKVKQLKIEYTISQISGGYHQICYPGSCTIKTTTGSWVMPTDTGNPSPIKADVTADLETEWYPSGEGTCSATYTLHIYQYDSGSYVDEGVGATVTVNYVYDPASVTRLTSDEEQVVRKTYYDLTGRKVSKPAGGIYIVRKELQNGKTIANKVYIK